MFNKARIKLTAWYLAIIMVISLAFSLTIYNILNFELSRFGRLQRLRIERQLEEREVLPENPLRPRSRPPEAIVVDLELMAETKHRLLIFLGLVNGVIFIFSGGLGYFLAGRTLKPIKDMVEEQNQFISDASHELKTPLTSLRTALEVHQRDKKLNLKGARHLIKDNIEEVNKLQTLTEGLLQLAQYEKPNHQQNFISVSLSKITKNAIQKIQPLADKKNITIVRRIKNLQLRGAPYALTDLLVILLDNAVKYSPKATKISVSSKKTDGLVSIVVSDQGTGISQKDLPYIFKRFYRSDAARSKKGHGGYGLGLSIAKKIVSAHHGNISVKTKLGKGSSFIIQIPSFS